VLPRWNSRVRLCLDDDGIRAAWRHGWRGARGLGASWKPETAPRALDVLIDGADRLLAELTRRGARLAGARCEVVVADCWMLYDVIEADLRDVAAESVAATLRAALADVAGAPPDALEVRAQPLEARRYAAAALPAASVRALGAVCAKHGLRLTHVTGEMVSVFNRERARLAAGGAAAWLLAVLRPAGAQLGLWCDGRLAAASFEPGARDAASVQRLGLGLARRAGVDEAALRCFAAANPDAELPAGWVVLDFAGAAP